MNISLPMVCQTYPSPVRLPQTTNFHQDLSHTPHGSLPLPARTHNHMTLSFWSAQCVTVISQIEPLSSVLSWGQGGCLLAWTWSSVRWGTSEWSPAGQREGVCRDNGGPVLRECGQGEPGDGLGVFVGAGNRGSLWECRLVLWSELAGWALMWAEGDFHRAQLLLMLKPLPSKTSSSLSAPLCFCLFSHTVHSTLSASKWTETWVSFRMKITFAKILKAKN